MPDLGDRPVLDRLLRAKAHAQRMATTFLRDLDAVGRGHRAQIPLGTVERRGA